MKRALGLSSFRRSPEESMTTAEVSRDPQELVARLGIKSERDAAWRQLLKIGLPARDAVLEGLRHANWEIRRWCAIWLDHYADAESLHALVPLLHDPKSKVRMFALHSLACDRCKDGENPIDVVPLLIERIQQDESIRVRRHAVTMLGFQHAHPDLEGFFQELLDTETDAKLHMHAGFGLVRCREAAEKDPLGRDG
jgi:HEAT repeat protein